MKILSLPALAAFALAPIPAWSAPSAAGEMELHIEARGSVMADYAVITRTFAAVERGRPATEAALNARLAEIKAGLLKVGVPATAIAVSDMTFQDGDAVPSNRFGFAEAMYAAKPIGVADPNEEDELVAAPAEGADEAADAAGVAAATATDAAKAVKKKRKLPNWSGSATLTVRLDDVRRYPAVTAVVGPSYRATDEGTDFRFNKPDTVHAAALADALASARAEADLHAKALGAHVLRISRVSNRETPITMPEIAGFFVQMEQKQSAWRLQATHSVSVAVDYVIAPN